MKNTALWTIVELRGASSAVKDALRISKPDQTLVLASEQDIESLHNEISKAIPAENILIQPSTWSNAAALLIQLLEIERQDRLASVLFLPALRNSSTSRLSKAWIDAVHSGSQGSSKVFVLRPGSREIPLAESALLASVSTFLLLYMITQPELLKPFLKKFHGAGSQAQDQAFEYVSSHDFCKDVLQPNPHFLHYVSELKRRTPPIFEPLRSFAQVGESPSWTMLH